MLGEQEEGDDQEASVMVELNLLGLPLPPLAPPTSLWKSTRVPLVLFPILGEPQYLRKAAVPAGGRAVPRHAGRGACAPPRLVAEGRGACEFGRTFRSLQDCGYLDFTLCEIPMIWFRSGVFHRG